MSDITLVPAVKAQLAVQSLLQRLAERRERGADALEYVGMVVLAGLIVAAIVAAIQPETLGSAVSEAVSKILGQ